MTVKEPPFPMKRATEVPLGGDSCVGGGWSWNERVMTNPNESSYYNPPELAKGP